MKTWSITTTMRNPERLRDILRVLKELEGQPFDTDNQVRYQILLIKNHLYKPTNLNDNQRRLVNDVDSEMSFEQAKDIFVSQNYEDPSMRGRTSLAPLKAMGFCTIFDEIKITELGKYFLSDDYDIGKVFLTHFLKWQLPNPLNRRGFSKNQGFDVKPFVSTLRLIKRVNELCEENDFKPVGISRDEFTLFVPTLINNEQIESQAQMIINYRTDLSNLATRQAKSDYAKNYKRNFAARILGNNQEKQINKLLSNLKDYRDSIIRYFRLTRYLHIRGGGYYVDLEPRRSIEIELLLKSDLVKTAQFENAERYATYLSDLKEPVLPWETEQELKRIVSSVISDIENIQSSISDKSIQYEECNLEDVKTLNREELVNYVDYLRKYRLSLQRLLSHFDSQDIQQLETYINDLQNIFDIESGRSIELEKLTVMGLNALNDAEKIAPNYPVGDDGNPTNTAPGGKADIECFYSDFNAICEVTLLKDRSQWYNEGQPVMRHLRDFEETNKGKDSYCLFVAPSIHMDTLETFRVSNKHGYRGLQQKILPITINQFVDMLQTLREVRIRGKNFSHKDLKTLYDKIYSNSLENEGGNNWSQQVGSIISVWHKSLVAS